MTDNPAMDPLSLAFRIAGVFDDLGIPYAIGGAVASAIHGEPRATEDLDVVAAIEGQHVQPLIDRLQPDYYVPVGLLREAVERHSSFNVIHLASVRKVDVFVAGHDELAREEMARRVPHTLPDRSATRLWIASPEDTILHKLRWYEKGGRVSDRQWRDILGVIKVQARQLDRGYLETWAGRLGVSPLLQQAFAQSDLSEDK